MSSTPSSRLSRSLNHIAQVTCMSIQSARTNAPRVDRSSAILDEAKSMVRTTVNRVAARQAATVPEAITAVARSAGLNPGTLENLLRERLKNLSAADYAAIRDVCIEEIAREIRSLERELSRARSTGTGARLRPADICEAEAALETARRLISHHQA